MDNLIHYVGAIEVELPNGSIFPLVGFVRDMFYVSPDKNNVASVNRNEVTPLLHPLSSMTEEHMREVIRLEQSEDSANLAKELSIVNNDCIWYSKYGRSGSRFNCPLRKLFPATTAYLLSQGFDLGILKEGTFKLQPVKAER